MTRYRRAVVLLDVVVATALVAVLISLSLKLLVTTRTSRQATDDRALALVAAANVAERVQTFAWEKIAASPFDASELNTLVAQSVPKATLNVAIVPEAGLPAARRIDIEISWPGPSGAGEAPVRLSCWRYAPVGGAAP